MTVQSRQLKTNKTKTGPQQPLIRFQAKLESAKNEPLMKVHNQNLHSFIFIISKSYSLSNILSLLKGDLVW